MEILPGKETGRVLPPGGRVAKTIPPANLDEIIRKVSMISDDVQKFTNTLSQTLGSEEGKQVLTEIILV